MIRKKKKMNAQNQKLLFYFKDCQSYFQKIQRCQKVCGRHAFFQIFHASCRFFTFSEIAHIVF